jgi:16S rRNA C1402 (ribose-2'-O) methylase RsmI
MPKILVGSMPIGNSEDLSFRMKRLLVESKLLITESSKFISDKYPEIMKDRVFETCELGNADIGLNSEIAFEKSKKCLEDGHDVLIISDEGCPSLGEPTPKLIKDLHSAGYDIETIPGPSIITSSLIHSTAYSWTQNFAYMTLSWHNNNMDTYCDFLNKMPDITVISVLNHQLVDSGIMDRVLEECGNRLVLVVENMSIPDKEIATVINLSDLKELRPIYPFTIIVLPKNIRDDKQGELSARLANSNLIF